MKAQRIWRARGALLGGLLWGLAILTRETVLYFLPIVAQTRALPQLIGEARSLLAEAWRA